MTCKHNKCSPQEEVFNMQALIGIIVILVASLSTIILYCCLCRKSKGIINNSRRRVRTGSNYGGDSRDSDYSGGSSLLVGKNMSESARSMGFDDKNKKRRYSEEKYE